MSNELPTLDQHTGNSESQGPLFHFVKEALFRYWLLILLSTLLGGSIGFVYSVVTKQTDYSYAAQSVLVVKQSMWRSAALSDVGFNVTADVNPTRLVEQLVRQDLGRDVARLLIQEDIASGRRSAVITDDAELDQQAEQIMSMIQLTPEDTQGLIRVTALSDASQEDANRVAEAAARVMIDHTQLHRLDEQSELHSLVLEELEDLREKLDVAQNRQWQYREEMGFRSHEHVWVEMEEKKNQLLESQMAIEVLDQELAAKDRELQENDARLPDQLGTVSDSVVDTILQEISQLRAEDVKLSVVWTDQYPDRMAIQDKIEEKREAALKAIEELKTSQSGGTLWAERQQLYRAKIDLDAQLAAQQIRKRTLESTLREMIADLPDLNEQSFEFEQLSREIANLREQYSKILEKEFEIESSIEHGTATVERRQATAALPRSVSPSTSTTTYTGIAGFMGFIFGFALSMFREMGDTSIKGHDDIVNYLNLDVIGVIPEMHFGKATNNTSSKRNRRRGAYTVSTNEELVDASIVTQHDPKSPISEAYRSLRTNFQFATLKQQPKSIMVTSSVPGEGKTTTAVNFAVTMADRGMRVLVVDTDLRRPNVHRVLKMERGSGLADVLREQIPVNDVIRPTRTENLWIISSGRVPPNPSELIGSQRMKRLMEELGKSFDLVVCDAPSVLVVTDPVLLAANVDTVALVVSVEYASRETIQRAKAVLSTAAPHIAGVVLNGLKTTARHYYYYYYYYDDTAQPGRRRAPHIFGG